MKKAKTNPNLTYPDTRWRYYPTPANDLAVCDFCNETEWTYLNGYNDVMVHSCRGGVKHRMRLATPEEKEKGLQALKEGLVKIKERYGDRWEEVKHLFDFGREV